MGALTTTDSKQIYTGDGSSVGFSVPWLFYADADLNVYLKDTTGSADPVLLTDPTHYSVTGAGDAAGGTVTMVTAPIATEELIIEREVSETQESAYTNYNRFPAPTVEKNLNRLTMMVQQLTEKISRSLIKPIDATTTSSLPSPVTDLCLKWNSSGDLVNSTTDPDVTSDAAAASAAAALVSENNAATSETNAATSETNAGVSETNAAASAAAAAASATSIVSGLSVAKNVRWDCASDTVVTIRTDTEFRGTLTGNLFTFASDKTFTITGTAGTIGALDQGSEASSTWYYLIALGDTTAVTATDIIAVSAANYASWTVANLTGNYSVFDDFKRIGAVYNDSSSNLLRGFFSENKFWFDEGQFTLSLSTSSATFEDADCSAGVPPVSNELFATFYLQSTAAESQIKRKGAGSTTGVHIFEATSGLTNNSCEVLLNDSQVFEWKTSAGSFGISSIVNYTDNLQKEK